MNYRMVNMPSCRYCKKEVDLTGDYILVREYKEGKTFDIKAYCNFACLKQKLNEVEP